MNPKDHYQKIIQGITDIDARRVARALTAHIGKENSIDKRTLVMFIYGKYTSTTERQVRDIVADLVTNYRYPVCTSSSTGGYWIAANKDEAIEAARDIESRITDLSDRAKALRSCDLPAVLPDERARAAQGSLL